MKSLATELSLDFPFSDLRHETLLNIVHTANLLASAGGPLFRQFGLTEAQFNLLFALLHKRRDITQTDLGKRLVVTRATITSVLDKLEEKGLVERRDVPANRRIYHVELTPEGRALIEELEPLYREEVHRAMADLSDGECRDLITCLERVRATTAAVKEGLAESLEAAKS